MIATPKMTEPVDIIPAVVADTYAEFIRRPDRQHVAGLDRSSPHQ